jgi:hypothetical protein
MHLRELFPADLEECRYWQLQLRICDARIDASQGNRTPDKMVAWLGKIVESMHAHHVQSELSVVPNLLNPVTVNLCPYVVGYTLQNPGKARQFHINWGDYVGFIGDMLVEFGPLYIWLSPSWKHDPGERIFVLRHDFEIEETFYHLEDGGV